MNTITSELKFTEVEIPVDPGYDNYLVDRYSHFYDEEFSKHLRETDTHHSECFYYYNNDSIIGNSLRHYGEYTEMEVRLLYNFLNENCVVYDIGANIGYHTVAFAKRAKSVYAFEPNTKNYKLLQLNSFHNNNIHTYELAVGSKNSVGYIEDFDFDSIGNLGELHMSDTGQKTNIVNLDDYIKTNNLPIPNVVKIDVEGYEWEVIQGMMKIIEQHTPIIFYEHLHGDDLPKVSKYLSDQGYTQYWVPVSNYNPQNYKKNKHNIFGQGGVLNVLAVPKFVKLQTNMPLKIEGESYQECVEKLMKTNAQ